MDTELEELKKLIFKIIINIINYCIKILIIIIFIYYKCQGIIMII
jgi:hypothetical protein